MEEYVVEVTTDKDKTYTVIVDEDLWNSLSVGDGTDIEVTSGNVTKINDIVVR